MTDTFTFTVTATDGAARDRRDPHAARGHPHAGLHAGRHRRDRQGHVSRPGQGARRRRRPRQHLSSHAAAGRGARRAARRAARLHELALSDPHRFGRLPGHVAGAVAPHRRERRHLPVAYRRLDACADARALDRDPGAARRRHPDAARRMRAPARRRRRHREGDAAVAALGRALPRRLRRAARQGAVRHRAGRHRSRACASRARRRSSPWISRATPSAASPSASRRTSCWRRSRRPCRICRPTSRAT